MKPREIADRSPRIAGKTGEIADRSPRIAGKTGEIADRSPRIAGKTKEIADRSPRIAGKPFESSVVADNNGIEKVLELTAVNLTQFVLYRPLALVY